MALGLELAGIDNKLLVEVNQDAAQTLRKNRPSWQVVNEDIAHVTQRLRDYVDLPQGALHLLSGGYPCQSFSYAGKRLGLEDTKGTMFYHYARTLEQLMPKMFLVENVKGMSSHDKGRTIEVMLNTFTNIGYTVKWQTLNAWDFGVPQKRERVIMVGIRNDLPNIQYKFPQKETTQPTLRNALQDVPESPGCVYPEKKRKVLEMIPAGGNWRALPEDIAKDYMGKDFDAKGGRVGIARRLSWDRPAPTATCDPLQKRTEMCHPEHTRPLTTREYARIQSFPDSWEFAGNTRSIYKQIGNAVPARLASAVGRAIVECLSQMEG